MKWIRWWGLGVFVGLLVLLSATWYLLAPWLVKSSIEGIGSEAVGAQVDVEKVELGLFPAKFNLKSLQVTNPDAPMTNLVEIGEISLAVDSSPLFWKKLIVEEMIISGVKLSTPRKQSGELEGGRKTEQVANAIANFELPAADEIDTEKLIEEADLLTPKRIEAFNTSKNEIEEYWSEAFDKNKNEAELTAIQDEFNNLQQRAKENKLNVIKDRKKWKSLKKKIKQQQDKYTELKKRLASDKDKLSKQIKLIKQGPSDDLERLMNKVGLGEGGVENISEKFLGPKITPWVLKGLELAKNYQSTPATEDDEVLEQGLGRRVYFKDQQLLPELLIKNIVINGEQDSWRLEGKGNDIAVPPWQWKKPADLFAEFSGNGSANFRIKSAWKSENEMETKINAMAKNWALTNYILKQDNTGSFELLSAVINSSLKGNITLTRVDLKFDISISSPKISYPDSISGWQKQLMEGINQQQSIDIKVEVSGDLLNPKIKLKSGLEKIFKTMLSARLSEQTDNIKQSIQAKLSEKIGDLSSFQNLDFSAFMQQLNLQDNQLGDLLGNF